MTKSWNYMYVVKRTGEKEQVCFDKIKERINKLMYSGEERFIDPVKVGQKVIAYIHSGITTEELDIESAKICENMCTQHPLYSHLGGRILVSNLHKKTFSTFSEKIKTIYNNIDFLDDNYYNYVMENYHELDQMIDYNRDFRFNYFGFKTLERAYLIKNIKTGKYYERPQDMFMRVASFLNMGDLVQTKKTYDLLSQGAYIHASPTLFNSGCKRSQLSSCFLLGTKDSLEGITDTWKSVANISKWGGGIGLHVSNIRSKNSIIRGTNGPSSGIIPMLQVYNSIARYVNQCFVGETLVYTINGPKKIKEIKVGDNVITHDGYKPVENVKNDYYNGVGIKLKLKHDFVPIYSTPDHQVLVVKNVSELPLEDLKRNLKNKNVNPEWVMAKNITSKDLVLMSIPKIQNDNSIYTEADCYAYGLVMKYGEISEKEFKITQLENKQKEWLKQYLTEHMINFDELNDGFVWYITSKFKFSINSFINKNGTKRIDSSIMQLSKYKLIWLIKGLSHDSYIDVNNKELADDINFILMSMGIMPEKTGSNNKYRLDYSPKKLQVYQDENYFYLPIKSIENYQLDTIVYDLEIKDHPNYLTHFGLVHNGGKRKGSVAIYLEPHHPDIFEFLDLRKNFGEENLRARDLFLALWVSDLFMKQVEKDGDWYLLDADECPGLTDVWGKEYEKLYWSYVEDNKYRKKIKARDLIKAVWESQQETGTPYITYKDNVNKKSNQKNLGTIKSSNLCNEIVEYSNADEHAVCNLASIALNHCLIPFDYSKYKFIVYTKPECNYCYWSKNWLKNNQANYQTIDTKGTITEKLELENIISEYKQIETLSFPQILACDNNDKMIYIGGFEDLVKFTRDTYNYQKLEDIAYTATRNLNRVIDINYYPTIETKRSNMRHRPIGLGIQGLADTLVRMGIPFDSEESVDFNKYIMETIYYASVKASVDIAQERHDPLKQLKKYLEENQIEIPEYYQKDIEVNDIYHKYQVHKFELSRNNYLGSYSSFEGSPASQGKLQFDLWGEESEKDWSSLKYRISKYGLRNSLLVALMPTASTSQIMGNNECFEFFTSNIYTRNTLAGDFPVINKYLVNDLYCMEEWNNDLKNMIIASNGSIQPIKFLPASIRRLYQTQWEIKQIWVLKNARARAPFVDQTQSMNVFMEKPNDQKLNSCLFWGWKNGLKTGMYYLRTKPSVNATKFTIEPSIIKKLEQQDKEEEDCIMCSS